MSLETKRTRARFDQSFEETMILFNNVVEVYDLSQFTPFGNSAFSLGFIEGF
jgi:hypothetical protein